MRLQARQRLIEAGYVSVSQVASPGEYAVRGSLFDVYPMGTTAPLRIDLFDNEIEAIRRFDPETQRSVVRRGYGPGILKPTSNSGWERYRSCVYNGGVSGQAIERIGDHPV